MVVSNVYEKVEDLFVADALAPQQIKGQDEPIETYKIKGRKGPSNG